jgi:cytochrome c oxidase assembly factor CtaG
MSRGGRWAALAGGGLALWIAVGSPLSHLDHVLLTAHMLQHLLIMTVAAPLLLLGAPLLVTPRVSAAFGPFRELLRAVTHPVLCWLAGTAVVIVWHVPAVFALLARSGAWHAVQQASFLVAGLFFWWPVVRPWPALVAWPRWSMPLYLFLATLPCDALSAFLAFSGRVVYPQYLEAKAPFGLPPLADQACAGALMWTWVTFAYLVPAVVITVRLLSAPTEGGHPVTL